MSNKEQCSILSFYAISPIHAGSGSMIGAIDLPVQRERHTNWPHIQASSVKGALRDHYRSYAKEEDKKLINFIFGSDTDNDELYFTKDILPGAIAVSDAKLLAFPVRSNIAPFVWVTCPLIADRLNKDLQFLGESPINNMAVLEGEKAFWIKNHRQDKETNILLEDTVVKIEGKEIQKEINEVLKKLFPNTLDRLILIPNDIFTYLVETATEIQTQIKIDSKTGITKTGSLRYQELLPADSVLYSVIYIKPPTIPSENDVPNKIKELNSKIIMDHLKNTIKDFIQLGGDETLGRGICSVQWYIQEENNK